MNWRRLQKCSQLNLATLATGQGERCPPGVALEGVFSQQSSGQQAGDSEMSKAHYPSSDCVLVFYYGCNG